MKSFAISVFGLCAVLGLSTSALADVSFPRDFNARLSGAQEVPEVITNTRGRFDIEFNKKLTKASFELSVRDGVAVTNAHIHCAPAGENGAIVVFLFGPDPGIDVDGELSEDTFTNDDIIDSDPASTCGVSINNIASLLAALFEGRLYVNVHTTVNPTGEVRGQLFGGHASD